eukprot:5998380-Ditylum_brightwellii.AAC.1
MPVPSVDEKDDVAESNEGDSATKETSLGVNISRTGKDSAISSSDELKPDRIAIMVTENQKTTVSRNDSTDKQPNQDMI